MYNSSLISDPPSFTSRPSNQTVIEGTNVTFRCSASGNPHPDISWLKDGKTVAEGDTLSLETSKNDSGKYWCLAKNGVGETINTTVYLDVQCKFGNNARSTFFFKAVPYDCYRNSLKNVKVDQMTQTVHFFNISVIHPLQSHQVLSPSQRTRLLSKEIW